jgi:predicted alpha/beta superfamily hydrolase
MTQISNFPPVTISNSESRILSSSIVEQDNHIHVSFPLGYAKSDASYPVVYVLDGDFFFELVTGTIRFLKGQRIPESLIVGICYGTQLEDEGNQRTRDYTPSVEEEYPGSGGAANFLRFMREELIPFIDSNYRTDSSDRTIVGGSFSGLFTLYALLHSPETFQRYVALSPSLRWSKRLMFDCEKEFAARRSTLPAKLFLSVGELESLERMLAPVKDFASILERRNYQGLDVTLNIIEGETHLSAQVNALLKGMRAVHP